jgi:ubiquinone/menaquinone biosynthesis C-methylase UbiE
MAEAEKVRRIYHKRDAQYDASVIRPWVEALRADLFGRARGDVLELGVGTGATFAHYPANVASLTGLDISEGMLALARPKAALTPFPRYPSGC